MNERAHAPAVPTERARRASALSRDRVRSLIAIAATSLGVAGGWSEVTGCGGSSGREDLPAAPGDSGEDVTVDVAESTMDGGGSDATVGASDAASADGGDSFDTSVTYADRMLPDIQAAPEGGAASARQWPMCAPDFPAACNPDGAVVTLYWSTDASTPATAQPCEVPAVFLDDGGQGPAPPGSPCATQVYLGSAACDQCERLNYGTNPWVGEYASPSFPTIGSGLPPCSDMWEAGVATVGPGAGRPRYDLCVELFNCLLQSGCLGANDPSLTVCICRGGVSAPCLAEGGNGPCYPQELAALEISTGDPLKDFQQVSSEFAKQQGPGHGGGAVNAVFMDIEATCRASCPFTQAADAGAD